MTLRISLASDVKLQKGVRSRDKMIELRVEDYLLRTLSSFLIEDSSGRHDWVFSRPYPLLLVLVEKNCVYQR